MRNYEAAPVGDTAAALIENANGDVDDAIETAEFMRKKTESQIEKARQDAEEAEDPETHQDIKNRIKEMEGHVKYWDDVVKFLEDVKKGAEVQAEEEAKAEEEANVPVEENAPAEENAPSQEETNAPEANEEKGADEVKDADNKAAENPIIPTALSEIPQDWKNSEQQEKEAVHFESPLDIPDELFTSYSNSVLLPPVSESMNKAIGGEGKPILIKRSVFAKNDITHGERYSKKGLTPDESRNILNDALYNGNIVGRTQPIERPNYWVLPLKGWIWYSIGLKAQPVLSPGS